MKKSPTRAPGRPRAFDSEAAMDAATQVFWARGFADASLDELTAAMGISRPSLYGAFGDKQALYLACVERYRRWVEQAMGAALGMAGDLTKALIGMYADAIALYTAPAPEPRGCLLASAALADLPLAPANRVAVAKALRSVEGVLASFFVQRGLAAERAASEAALCATFLYGLSARARLGVEAPVLIEDARRFVARLTSADRSASAG